ncbi:MAG: carbamoyltransferase C-terminal domain-containing protein [Endomicrobiaceae bacterium]|nr:carbamoyltransferase C-terminal domain-containing protein [Endomicrobiaceae bacterium]MDD3922736.1 carbamoyltransferase C-terminal domain-containing protein [Endomicrobiaceae bacterium]
MKTILGINGGTRAGNQDSSATIIANGQIIACAEEERFTKIKHAPGVLPENSIKFCLQQANINIQNVDFVVFAGATYDSMTQILTNFFNFKFKYCPKIILIDHHLAHASSAYYVSGFDNSYIITADFSGDNRSTVLFYADRTGIKEITNYSKPNSLGLFYAAITQFLGFKYDNDECKTMALAGYNSKTNSIVSQFLNITDKTYSLNTNFLDSRIMYGKSNPSRQEPLFNDYFIKQIQKTARIENNGIDDFYLSVAKTAQESLEKAYFTLIKQLKNSQYKSNNLCLAGGVALNAELNSKLAYSNEFDNMFVQPVASDAGLSLGGALYVANKYNSLQINRMNSVYFGSEFSNKEIKKELNRVKTKYIYYESNMLTKIIAKRIAQGQIGAIFNGKMEYGPRALGNRSIIADPRSKTIKNILNKEFKQRETFQPFAPSVLEEYAEEYFDFPNNTSANFEFMVINAKIKQHRKNEIIATIHINNTARVQIVKKDRNPFFYDIIKQFGYLTNTNVLLNTSLNKKGFPITRTPNDALNVFYTTPLDFMVLGNYIIEK